MFPQVFNKLIKLGLLGIIFSKEHIAAEIRGQFQTTANLATGELAAITFTEIKRGTAGGGIVCAVNKS